MTKPSKASNVLITGMPEVGKTTLIRRLAERLAIRRPMGFYTEEIRQSGVRRGFELVTFDGRRRILSHVDIAGPYRVGKYGVDVGGFEAFLDELDLDTAGEGVVIIDEIGKMECFSRRFVTLVQTLLDSPRSVIATVALKGGGLIAEVRRRPDARIFTVTAANRDSLAAEITAYIEGH